MAVRDWACDADYDLVDRMDVAGLAWEFARRDPRLRAAAASPAADLSPWGLAAIADPALDAERTEVWWRWDFAPGVVVRFVVTADSELTVARLRAAAAAAEGQFLRFPNGLQAVLPQNADGATTVAAVLPLDRWFGLRAAAAESLRKGLDGRWRAVPLPPRWRRARLRLMMRALDARAAGASWREIALRLLGARFADSSAWKDSPERGVALRLAAAGLALARGGYVVLLRRRAVSRG